ncbi:DUF3027 domain-containing protein [Agromyces italicus]|uniref:DUF3027 domain-containing protein n=1 Tax=Agromyces italicus TaxID=279572 RepID=UPI0003B693AE|nr:DUF3027 domain-containing protein [Agromyces italicus]
MPETPETQQPADEVSPTAAEISPDDSADARRETAPPVADEVLLASVDLARRALLEVTAPETVGSVIGHIVEGEHVVSLLFAADLAGYPGWRWSVTIARVDDAAATVLETELMPGDQALLAPEWVPWSERLAEYRAAQQAAAELAAASDGDEAEASGIDDEHDDDDDLADEDEDDDLDDEDEDSDDDDDDDGLERDDDFDGIDIDALDLDATRDADDGARDDEEAAPAP